MLIIREAANLQPALFLFLILRFKAKHLFVLVILQQVYLDLLLRLALRYWHDYSQILISSRRRKESDGAGQFWCGVLVSACSELGVLPPFFPSRRMALQSKS